MKRIIYGATVITIMLFGCKESFKKAKDGTEYKLISNSSGKKAVKGNFMELDMLVKYNDSVLFNSYETSSPRYIPFDTAQLPVFFKEIHEGDSLIMRIKTDSLIANGQAAPFMKKGQYLYQYFKISKLFNSKEEADAAAQAHAEIARQKDSVKAIAQLAIDDKTVADYLAKNKITAVKAPQGTYVEILTPGTGDAIDTSKVVKINYTGKTMTEGKAFDSNTDPTFQHTEPIRVTMSAPFGSPGSVIKGWTDGLSLLKKGAKAKFYIPSALAYGSHGAGKDIKPNENLIFDIEVMDVITAAQAKVEAEAEKKKYEDMQKKMMDSVKNARKDTMQGK